MALPQAVGVLVEQVLGREQPGQRTLAEQPELGLDCLQKSHQRNLRHSAVALADLRFSQVRRSTHRSLDV
ncbi:MAG: hypothetical protein HC832_04450, partial [Leptolyngbyaceae cyanobacterium RM1_405_57]|nr:hypothetical protein [Leptolyngbyaceae cyanobacterium RM1_405_57]